MKSKFLVVLLMLGLVIMSQGTAQAATSAIDNLPGGAGIFYWEAGGGQHTYLDIHNVASNLNISGQIDVHIAFYDRDSEHLFDYVCTLTELDHYGVDITADTTNNDLIKLVPGEDGTGLCYQQDRLQFNTASTTNYGSDTLRYGYGTVTITKVATQTASGAAAAASELYRSQANSSSDSTAPLQVLWADADDDNSSATTRQTATLANLPVVLPDFLYISSAILNNTAAYAIHGAMLQGFMNINKIQSAGAQAAPSIANGVGFVNITGTNAFCDNPVFGAGAVLRDDFNGILVQAAELLITDNAVSGGIAVAGPANSTDCDGQGATPYRALGAAAEPNAINLEGYYWARFASDDREGGANTITTIVTIAPASTVKIANPAENPAANIFGPYGNRNMEVYAFDDNEQTVSTKGITPPEVGRTLLETSYKSPGPSDSAIEHKGVYNGTVRIASSAPMFGFSFIIDQGIRQDLYPLVKNRMNINVHNLYGSARAARIDFLSNFNDPNPIADDVRQLGY